LAAHFTIRTARRYYLRGALEAEAMGDFEIALALRGKQRAEPATDLPTFSASVTAKLAEADYLAVEDLDGADVDELTRNTELTRAEATMVVAAIEALES
jgi:hypothetical protein